MSDLLDDKFLRRLRRTEPYWEVDILPRAGVVQATPVERAIARIVKGLVLDIPKDNAQADLLGDIFFAMYQNDPHMREKERIPPERAVNAAIMNWVTNHPDFNKNRWPSVANIPAALASSGVMWEGLVTDKALQEALVAQQKAEQARKELEDLLRRMMQSKGGGSPEDQDEVEKKRQEIQDWADKGVKALDHLKQNPLSQGLVGGVIKDSSEKGQKIASAMKGWGIEPGNLNPVDSTGVLRMLEKSEAKIRLIAEIAGRFRLASANAIEKTRRADVGPVTEIALTRSFLKLLPTERFAFSDKMPKMLRTNKILQFVTHGLPGFKQKSEGKKSGSFRAMVDGSGSMSGMQEVMAKAVALGLAYAVRQDKDVDRHYTLYMFGTHYDGFDKVTSEEGWKEHVDWANHMYGGGTDFNYALRKAVEDIRNSSYTGEDLLFITDGEAYINDTVVKEWKTLKSEKGCKLMYVAIGTQVNSQIKSIADMVIEVKSLDEENSEDLVVKITEQIIKSELSEA